MDPKKIALERIIQLFDEAEKRPKLADRYVQLARKISMKINLKMPKNLKRKFCKHCYKYLTSENSRQRIHKSRIIIYCKNCKKYTRIPLK